MGVSKEIVRADYAVLGHPISHSLSPTMHNAVYAHFGLDFKYVAIDVQPEDLLETLDYLKEIGFNGVNLTVPLKEVVLGWDATFDQLTKRIGACNTLDLTNRRGTNTDAPGFVESIASVCAEPGSAVILGAGGSSAAVAVGLKDTGWKVSIWNRTPDRAATLASRLEVNHLEVPDVSNADLIVNATAASLKGESLPVDWAAVKPGAAAVDLAYGENLPFLQEALPHVRVVMDGRLMLVNQADHAFEYWLGLKGARTTMLKTISIKSEK